MRPNVCNGVIIIHACTVGLILPWRDSVHPHYHSWILQYNQSKINWPSEATENPIHTRSTSAERMHVALTAPCAMHFLIRRSASAENGFFVRSTAHKTILRVISMFVDGRQRARTAARTRRPVLSAKAVTVKPVDKPALSARPVYSDGPGFI